MGSGETKYWVPPDGDGDKKAYWSFNEIVEQYGLEVARYCKGYNEDREPYPPKLISMMYAVRGGRIEKVETEEQVDEYFKGKPDKKDVHIPTIKKRAVAAYKGAETRKKNKVISDTPKPGSAAERAYRGLDVEMEANSILGEIEAIETVRALDNIDPFVACQSRVEDTTAVDNRLIGGENIMSSLQSPLMVLLYLLQHRPFVSKNGKYMNREYLAIYQHGYIGVNTTIKIIAKRLKLTYKTAYNYIRKLKEDRIIFEETIEDENYFIVGYVEKNKEIYFYNLPLGKRILPVGTGSGI